MKKRVKIFVLGGYGNFGKRLCLFLANDPALEIVVGGRDLTKIEKLIEEIKIKNPQAVIEGNQIDWQETAFKEKLKATGAHILVHSAGPFQQQDYTVAQACIDLKIHYLDLADGREFVSKIGELDKAAKENKVVVISGASSVPGISSVVIDEYAKKFAILREIDFGIVPGNKAERGSATIAAILGYVGKPFRRLENGRWKTVYAWQDLHQYYYGDNISMRWHANIDIPDLALLPEKYTTLKTVTFYAGLELSLLHFAMWWMSWLVRMKIVRNWGKFYKCVVAMSRWFDRFGTDVGGMVICMRGSNHEYQPLEVKWTLIAQSGSGPFIPIVASVILVKKIIQGALSPGAMPCVNLFSLKEFYAVISLWDIYSTVEEVVT